MKLTVVILDGLHREFKACCVYSGVSMQEVIEELLSEYVKQKTITPPGGGNGQTRINGETD